MKQPLKRAATFVLALLMTLTLVQHQSSAVLENVYFSAANDQLMPLNDETMPFYSGNVLYICQTMFEGTDLGVRYVRNYSMNLAMLYTPTTNLQFHLVKQTVVDGNGHTYSGKAIEKSGYVFFPMELVCQFFGLNWSIRETPTVPLVRVSSETVYLDDNSFIRAASSMMAARYTAYEKHVNESKNNSGNNDNSGNNENNGSGATTEPPDITPPIHAAAGQKLYLLMRSTSEESTRTALELLDGRGVTFLLTAEQMENGDLLRAILGSGHAVALYVQGRSEEDILEEIRYARELFQRASCSLLQLVWYDGQTDISQLLEEQGIVSITATLDHSNTKMKSSDDAKSLLHLIGKHREDLSVFLGSDEACIKALDSLLTQLSEAQYRLCAWRLTH